MFYLAGTAASSALDLISSLQQALGGGNSSATSGAFAPATTSATSTTPSTTTTSAPPSAPAAPLSPSTMNALFSLQGQGQQPLLMVNGNALSQQMFSLLDSNGDGAISQSEFDAAFGQNGNTAQANSLFAEIDTNGDGSISLQELTNALDGQDPSGTQGATQGSQTQGAHHHHHHGGGGFDIASLLGGPSADGGANAPGGAGSNTSGDTTQTVTNADGSSTTTITYADGSQVTMTIPAANSSTSSSNSGAGSVASLNNFIEQMIQRQAQLLASSSVGQSLAVSA